MLKRLIAITVIFIGAGIAWMILGGTLVQRTGDSDSTQRAKLTAQWGGPQAQTAPSVQARVARETYNQDKQRAERAYQTIAVPLRSSRIDVKLDLEQRRVGLLWYNLYSVRFAARYRVRNDTPSSATLRALCLSFEPGDLRGFQRDGGRPAHRRSGGAGQRLRQLRSCRQVKRRRSLSGILLAAWRRGATASEAACNQLTISRSR